MPIMCSPLSGCHTDSSQSICSIFRCHTFIKHMWDFSASGICQKPLWHHSSLVILHYFVSVCYVCSSSRFTYHAHQPPPIWQTKPLCVVVLFQFSILLKQFLVLTIEFFLHFWELILSGMLHLPGSLLVVLNHFFTVNPLSNFLDVMRKALRNPV